MQSKHTVKTHSSPKLLGQVPWEFDSEMDLCIQVYWGVLLGIIAPVKEQKKRQDRAEKLNCDAIAPKVSVDLIRNSEGGISFQDCLE